jgi:hypothetical protein
VKEEDKQVGKSKLPRAWKVLIAIMLILILILGSAFSLLEYQKYTALYHKDTSLAQVAIQHLRSGMLLLETLPHHPFDAPTVQHARQEFASALAIFVQLHTDLQLLPGISTSIPKYGLRLSSALHLLPLAMEVSQIGMVACSTLSLLISKLHDPLHSQGQGLTWTDISLVDDNFHQVWTALNSIVDQVNSLQPADLQLDPRLGKIVATFHKDLPALQAWLDRAEKLLSIAPALLGIGTPTNYLVEVLDTTELRPGGGFIGNYGIATFSGGRLTTAHITDSYLLDGPFETAGKTILYPAAYSWFNLASSWSFRDSNLDADFPTAARYAEQNYKHEGGNVPVQGVIAITPALIQHVLEITGPINVPEYHQTVTVQNLIDLIHAHQLGSTSDGSSLIHSADGLSSQRKHFAALLAEHLLARADQLPPSAIARFGQLLVDAIRSKDIQVYLNSSEGESLLQQFGLDAAIQSPAGESLFVVDANIAGNKVNGFINDVLDDQVTIDREGNAIHHTTISYTWSVNGETYGAPLYQDYIRVYVPPASFLQKQDGWQARGTSRAFGREVWAGLFTLSYGQTDTITLTWTVPGVVAKDTKGWHYRYVIQRQAGTQWSLHLQIKLPSCAAKTSMSGGLVSSKSGVATYTQAFNEDLHLGIDYAC